MPGPVVIDDGGSIRVKDVSGPLHKLIQIDPVTRQSKDSSPGSFSKIMISYMDVQGNATSLTGAQPIPITTNDSFEVFAGQQRIVGKIVGKNCDCEITIKGVEGTTPMVHAKYSDNQFTYVVTNAPRIDRVTINAAGPPVSYPVPPDTLYASVILS